MITAVSVIFRICCSVLGWETRPGSRLSCSLLAIAYATAAPALTPRMVPMTVLVLISLSDFGSGAARVTATVGVVT